MLNTYPTILLRLFSSSSSLTQILNQPTIKSTLIATPRLSLSISLPPPSLRILPPQSRPACLSRTTHSPPPRPSTLSTPPSAAARPTARTPSRTARPSSHSPSRTRPARRPAGTLTSRRLAQSARASARIPPSPCLSQTKTLASSSPARRRPSGSSCPASSRSRATS